MLTRQVARAFIFVILGADAFYAVLAYLVRTTGIPPLDGLGRTLVKAPWFAQNFLGFGEYWQGWGWVFIDAAIFWGGIGIAILIWWLSRRIGAPLRDTSNT